MLLRDVKRRYWCMIGLIVGLAISYALSSDAWDERLMTIGQLEFEVGLGIPSPRDRHIEQITVLPPVQGKHIVICTQLRSTHDNHPLGYKRVAYLAAMPFKSRETAATYRNVIEYLKAVQRGRKTPLNFNYAWYREKPMLYLLCTSASIVLIGGVWPTVVSLLVGAGFGFGPGEDTSFDVGGPASHQAPHAASDPSAVDDFNAEMESALPAAASAEPRSSPAATEVKELSSDATAPLLPAETEEEKDYRGEFYPVARPHGHDESEHGQS